MTQAFLKTWRVRGTTLNIVGHEVRVTRGVYVSEMSGPEFVEASGLHLPDSLNTFTASTLKTEMNSSHFDTTGRVVFPNGTIFSGDSGLRFHLEAIVDNPESPWIRFYLREV